MVSQLGGTMMNKKRNYIIILILLVIVIFMDIGFTITNGGLVGIFHLNDQKNKNNEINNEVVSSIEINEKKENGNVIYLNESTQLTLSDNLGNHNLSSWNYTWITSDSNVATISSTGLLIGKGIGNATIRVTNKNNVNLYDIINIQVISSENRLRFSTTGNNEDSLILGEVRKLSIITGGDVALHDIIWTSSNDNIISVKDGYVTANSLGKAMITVTSKFSSIYYDTITIEVKDNTSKLESPTEIYINHIYMNGAEISLEELKNETFHIGDRLVINANTNVSSNQQVTFESMLDNIELTSSNQFVGSYVFEKVGIGTIKIYSKYNESICETIDVVIGDDTKIIDTFILDNDTSVSINTYLELKMKNNDDFIPFDDLIVEVEDKNIIFYDSGYLCPIQEGKTNIKVIYLYDKKKQVDFEVEVTESTIETTAIDHVSYKYVYKNGLEYNMNKLDCNLVSIDDTITFSLEFIPLNNSYFEKIKVFSSDTSVASVQMDVDNYEYTISIHFLKKGNVDIIIKTFDDSIETQILAFQVDITENDYDFTIVRMNHLIMGKSYSLRLEKNGIEPEEIKYEYHSSDETVLSIGNTGEILAMNEGNVLITVIATYGRITIEKAIEITVVKEYKTYEKAEEMICKTYVMYGDNLIPIDFDESFLNVYQKAYLNVVVTPNNGTTKNYAVYSSDESIISLSYVDYQYQLYAFKPGIATIKIVNYENEALNQEITIHVYDVLPKYYLPILESNTLILGYMDDIDFIVDSAATCSNATYTFSNEGVAQLLNHKIIPVHTGETTLIITISNGLDTYTLSIPFQVIAEKEKGLFEYPIAEILVFFLLHVFVYLGVGISISVVFGKNKRKNVILLSILVLLLILECIKGNSIPIVIFTTIINIIFYCVGIATCNMLMVRSEKNEQ